ncbi:MAG TPA: signal peptide peptidase SppA [Stellaceae bacterium]|jgi:protease-4|nr:signal peptide peptidase SppA [Stellaceae bacterium]
MRRVIVGIFAAIGVFVFALVVVGVALWIFVAPRQKPLADADVLLIDLTKSLPEGAPQDGFERLVFGEQTSFRDVLDGIARAQADPRVKGIVARLGDGSLGTAQLQELRDAIARFRAAGKFAFGYAGSFGELGGGTGSYYLATAFDQIWLQPVGSLGLVGVRVEMPYFRGTLDKLGVEPRVDHREEFKTAANTLTDTKMTPADREQNEALLHAVYDQVVAGIAAGRRLDPARVRELIDQGPFTVDEAVEDHLVDHAGYREDAVAAARSRAGENAALVSLSRYLDLAGRPYQSGPTIAVIYGDGLITDGDSSDNALAGSHLLGADTLTRAFREAAADASVKAILFRIDSPGGSATASETIWRAVLRAREAGKPIVVSMGNVAGSGGYYIAACANKIVAEPATLTGSIGVVGGKVLIDGLSQKLGITWDGAKLGNNADIDSIVDDFTPAEHDAFERSLDYVYGVFKQRVAEGRKLSADAVEAVAKGRVWSGADAKAHGLVDALGGFDTALALAKQEAGIAAQSDVTLKTFPPPSETPAAVIARLLGHAPGEGERSAAVQLAMAQRALAVLSPVLQRLELAAAPPGALTMPPLELK